MNLIKDVLNIEFLNKIDNIIFELLYSANSGYITLNSKKAVENGQKYIEKLEKEIEKISQKYDIKNLKNIITQKQNEYIVQIKKHWQEELNIWIDEEFEKLISNIVFYGELNKNNAKLRENYYLFGINSIKWYCSTMNLEDSKCKNLIENFIIRFNDNKKIQSDETNSPLEIKTDYKTFISIWSALIDNKNTFADYDLNSYANKLAPNDIVYFKEIQKELLSENKYDVLCEKNMIYFALNKIESNNDREKYDFIKNTEHKLNSLKKKKDYSEEEKLKIIRKNISLFKSLKNERYKKEFFESII
jgi:translation elongation factor EF-G